MNYSITQATEQDWQLYKKIRLETLEQEPQAFSSTYKDALTFPDSKWKDLLNNEQSTYLLVLKDKNVIGVGRITFNDPDEPSNLAVLGGIYISALHRRFGVGRKLLEHLINIAKQRENIDEVKLDVKNTQIAAINLYKKLGFENVGKKDDEIIMKKMLYTRNYNESR